MVDFSAVRGGNAYDSDGSKVGSVDEVYTDKETGEPSFVTVNTGLFGSKTTFVPLADASVDGNDVRLPYDKSKIKDAPSIDPDAEISDEEQDRLYEYYGLGHSGRAVGGTGTTTGTVGDGDRDRLRDGDRDADRLRDGDRDHDRSRDANLSGDDSMTVSEERLRTGVREETIGRARLRKYVTTQHVSEEVPVEREEVRVTREPITDGGSGNATIGEEEVDVTLHGERVVGGKETVETERVRLDKETVRDTEVVEGDLRKENVDVDVEGDAGTRDRDRDRDNDGKRDRL